MFHAEIAISTFLGEQHLLTYGGNVRQNNLDVTVAPLPENPLFAPSGEKRSRKRSSRFGLIA